MPVSIPGFPVFGSHHPNTMARWFIYDVRWFRDAPPLPKNLAVANRRLRREDHEVPLLAEDGFVESLEWNAFYKEFEIVPRRWRSPLLTAEDVYRILLVSNANPGRVMRWECRCESWTDCDEGLTDCRFRRPHRGEDATRNDCVWVNEDFDRFYASRLNDRPKAFRNIPRFIQ
jgi:hypothetical protein